MIQTVTVKKKDGTGRVIPSKEETWAYGIRSVDYKGSFLVVEFNRGLEIAIPSEDISEVHVIREH